MSRQLSRHFEYQKKMPSINRQLARAITNHNFAHTEQALQFYGSIRTRIDPPDIIATMQSLRGMCMQGVSTDHEAMIGELMVSNGFIEMPRCLVTRKPKRIRDLNWIDKPHLAAHIPNGVFIHQPFGTQQSPDFIVKINSRFVLFLEAKSTNAANRPTYNSGGIHPDFLYVFSSFRTNDTTIFKGDSVITHEQLRLINAHRDRLTAIDNELNTQLILSDTNGRGINFYSRSSITQVGGSPKTDYFGHAQRISSENAAIEWLRLRCASDDMA
jgi:hypothetical protein